MALTPRPFESLPLLHGNQEFQQTLWEAYGSQTKFWLTESTASLGPGNTFPTMNDNIYAGFSMAPAYPLGYHTDDPSAQFYNKALPNVGGGVIYGSWLFWWFLAQYAELPGLVGQMCSLQGITNGEYNGLISSMRILVEARGLDFGDAWGIFIAHTRTWDVGDIGVGMAKVEAKDFKYAVSSEKLDPSITLERYKTTVELNASTGTGGQFVAGPTDQRPGPFSRNCLTARGVLANRVVGISIKWDDGMGFPSTTVPSTLKSQHSGCDADKRFYNSMVVVHNEATGERRYFKMKGKTPSTVYVNTGNNGPVTIHIMLLPTPPTDYVLSGIYSAGNPDVLIKATIPEYSYKYAISILGSLPSGATLSTKATKRDDGIVNFEPATGTGYWDVKCSCAFPVSSGICIEPTFQRTVKKPVSKFCFSGETTVDVKKKGLVSMSDLQLGDEVLVESGKYEAVYSFGHRHETTDAAFLRFLPSNVEMSIDHMVKIGDHYVPASSVEVGDVFETGTGEFAIIESIETVARRGVYAPFTPSGTIVVNDVKASCYVAFQGSDRLMIGGWITPLTYQRIAHLSQGPHRLWTRLFGIADEIYTDEGMSTWIEVPHKVALWYLDQNSFVMIVLIVPAILLLAVISATEAFFCWRL
jgi:hypothetical protein